MNLSLPLVMVQWATSEDNGTMQYTAVTQFNVAVNDRVTIPRLEEFVPGDFLIFKIYNLDKGMELYIDLEMDKRESQRAEAHVVRGHAAGELYIGVQYNTRGASRVRAHVLLAPAEIPEVKKAYQDLNSAFATTQLRQLTGVQLNTIVSALNDYGAAHKLGPKTQSLLQDFKRLRSAMDTVDFHRRTDDFYKKRDESI